METRTDREKELHRKEDERRAAMVAKVKALHAELVKLDPKYELVTARSYGIKQGIRLGDEDENAMLDIDEHYQGSYYNWKTPVYYVRITTTGAYDLDFKRNWTFETKDLVNKVHAKMTELLAAVQRRKQARSEKETWTLAAIAKTKATFPEQTHIGTTSEPNSIYVHIPRGERTWSISYNPDLDRVVFHDQPRVSRVAFLKMLDIIEEDLAKGD